MDAFRLKLARDDNATAFGFSQVIGDCGQPSRSVSFGCRRRRNSTGFRKLVRNRCNLPALDCKVMIRQ